MFFVTSRSCPIQIFKRALTWESFSSEKLPIKVPKAVRPNSLALSSSDSGALGVYRYLRAQAATLVVPFPSLASGVSISSSNQAFKEGGRNDFQSRKNTAGNLRESLSTLNSFPRCERRACQAEVRVFTWAVGPGLAFKARGHLAAHLDSTPHGYCCSHG